MKHRLITTNIYPYIIDTHPIADQFWGQGEPNQDAGTTEDRVSLLRPLSPSYSWNDARNTKIDAYKALCQINNSELVLVLVLVFHRKNQYHLKLKGLVVFGVICLKFFLIRMKPQIVIT